jgi:hypothetical protein
VATHAETTFLPTGRSSFLIDGRKHTQRRNFYRAVEYSGPRVPQ